MHATKSRKAEERSVSGNLKKDEKIHMRTGIKLTFSATFMMTCQERMLEGRWKVLTRAFHESQVTSSINNQTSHWSTRSPLNMTSFCKTTLGDVTWWCSSKCHSALPTEGLTFHLEIMGHNTSRLQ